MIWSKFMAAPAEKTSNMTSAGRNRSANRNLQKRARSMPNMLADDIRMQLVAGELMPGQPLPPENELLETYGISRPTLREAVRILEAESLVETVRGPKGGIIMRAPDPAVIVRQAGVHLQLAGATFADVYAARAALEIAAVRTLAEKHSASDIATLRAHINEGRASFKLGPADYGHAAGVFHRTLVHLSGNTTMSFMVDMLGTLTDATYNRRTKSLDPDAREAAVMRSLRSWGKLVDLIESGDVDGAEAHWTRHLAYVAANLGSEERPLAAEVLPRFDTDD
jgi:GntR family transcriptional regulator, transcriptional repressor for pyruvate dehydrogenase complex